MDTLSQSFSIPDEFIPEFSGSLFYQCVVLTDQYYAMGNAEGITFLASSGDGGVADIVQVPRFRGLSSELALCHGHGWYHNLHNLWRILLQCYSMVQLWFCASRRELRR